MNQPKNLVQKAGFTLIELSIVLVIIGLIVGGVLVGQDLIKAAEIRATIAQIEKYNSAVNTFQGKFNAKPGDITGTATGQAAQFGLFYETTLGGTAGHGDGNGLIEGGSAGATVPIGETLTFWRHLNDANLVDGSYGVVSPSLIVAADGTPTGSVTNVQQSIPQAKLGPAGSIIVYAATGLNFYQIVPVTGIPDTGAYTFGTTGMTPIQAFNIDSKLDDGAPNTGIVLARSLGTAGVINGAAGNGVLGANGAPSFAATGGVAAANGACVIGTGAAATDTYNRDLGFGGNNTPCSLRLRFN